MPARAAMPSEARPELGGDINDTARGPLNSVTALDPRVLEHAAYAARADQQHQDDEQELGYQHILATELDRGQRLDQGHEHRRDQRSGDLPRPPASATTMPFTSGVVPL